MREFTKLANPVLWSDFGVLVGFPPGCCSLLRLYRNGQPIPEKDKIVVAQGSYEAVSAAARLLEGDGL
jgi:hypothetical protein